VCAEWTWAWACDSLGKGEGEEGVVGVLEPELEFVLEGRRGSAAHGLARSFVV
jgi:hypothetical protein